MTDAPDAQQNVAVDVLDLLREKLKREKRVLLQSVAISGNASDQRTLSRQSIGNQWAINGQSKAYSSHTTKTCVGHVIRAVVT